MIKLFRVDHRLVHGQVAYSWSNSLGITAILIASDKIVNDEVRRAALKLAKPSGIKLVIKNIEDAALALNSGVTDKYNLLILTENISDAYELTKRVNGLSSLNLGGLKKTDGSEQVSTAVYLTPQDKEQLSAMVDQGMEIEIRQVPGESKVILSESDLVLNKNLN